MFCADAQRQESSLQPLVSGGISMRSMYMRLQITVAGLALGTVSVTAGGLPSKFAVRGRTIASLCDTSAALPERDAKF